MKDVACNIEAILNIHQIYTSSAFPGYETSLPIHTVVMVSHLKRVKCKRNKIPSNDLFPFSSPTCKCVGDIPHSLPATLNKAHNQQKWSHFDPFFVIVSLVSIS